jgi:hypothetical protein
MLSVVEICIQQRSRLQCQLKHRCLSHCHLMVHSVLLKRLTCTCWGEKQDIWTSLCFYMHSDLESYVQTSAGCWGDEIIGSRKLNNYSVRYTFIYILHISFLLITVNEKQRFQSLLAVFSVNCMLHLTQPSECVVRTCSSAYAFTVTWNGVPDIN